MYRKFHGLVCFIFITLLAAGSFPQEKRNVLTPESANEARLNRLQPPDQVMDAIGVKPGMSVAEIGAGRGRYVVQLAVRVGEEGKVLAEDISSSSLRHLEQRCRRWGLENVEIILGEVADPKLPEGTLDLIFIISSYHHFADPVTLLQKARTALKPGGILAIGEWIPHGENLSEAKTPDQMELEMKAAGYRLERTETFLKDNNMYLYIFRPAGDSEDEA